VPGAFYHVILRGNGRQDVFFDEADRLLWQHLIADRLDRRGHRLHAYCWMTNHVHMATQAHTVAVPGDYRCSSHLAYANGVRSEWLTVDHVLALFGPTAGQARAAFAAFVKAPVDEGL
jgi:REP element-mobilizing transposase RayT